MRKSALIRILAVSAAGLAIAAGAVGAVASSHDSRPETGQPQRAQEATPTPAPDAARPWLGIVARPFRDGEGVVIKHVAPDSPADDAGLEPGDVIRAIDGLDVQDVEDLRDAIDDKKVGDQVTLSVVKNGVENKDASPEDVKVTLGARPETFGPEDILPGAFDRFLGGSFKYLDADGNEVTIEVVPGTVKGVTEDQLTIDVNGDEGERKFSLPEAARVPDDLAEGARVTVVLKDGEVQGVFPGVFGLFGPPGLGPDGIPLPFRGRFHKMPFGDGPFPFGPGHGLFPDCPHDEAGESSVPDA